MADAFIRKFSKATAPQQKPTTVLAIDVPDATSDPSRIVIPNVEVTDETQSGIDISQFRNLLVGRTGHPEVELPGVEVDTGEPDAEAPGVEVELPGTEVELPGVEVDTGEPDAETPGVEVELPGVEVELPGTEVELPGVEAELPGVEVDEPQVDVEIGIDTGKFPVKPRTRRKVRLVDIGNRAFTRKRGRQVKAKLISLPAGLVKIGDLPLAERLGSREGHIFLKQPGYFRNNREIFVNFINGMFTPYRKLLEEAALSADCSSDSSKDFSLLAHQLMVRDYLNLHTPYRGLLLYHGLGSGKTCASVAIAEGMKEDKEVIVMTPASLRVNYKEEIKKCGDPLYRKLQHWEYIDATPENIDTLSYVLKLPKEYIEKNRSTGRPGAWLVNATKQANYESLAPVAKESLDKQLDEMISYKYRFISYNGLRKNHIDELVTGEDGKKINPFDNKVVIIDEAHNLVSMIVNKLGKEGEVATQLYELIMGARRARIVMLSGTPIINYPSELGIMFNMLRGYIRTWRFTLATTGKTSVSEKTVKSTIFKASTKLGRVADYVKYTPSTAILEVTRNPFGFINKMKGDEFDGVKTGVWGEESDEDFVQQLVAALQKHRMSVRTYTVENFKALPDSPENFKELFLTPDNDVKNMDLFKRRIIGLASYFPDIYSLMPKYDKTNFHVDHVPMSDFQFGAYEEIRAVERKEELRNAAKRIAAQKKGIFEETTSSYRTFSRAFCNYVFPAPDLVRPFKQRSLESKLADAGEEDLEIAEGQNDEYGARIAEVMAQLDARKQQFLSTAALATYSPKFLAVLERLQSPENPGLHLIYSQFRTVEGIGVLRLVLLANGFSEFKIRKGADGWELAMTEQELLLPSFALYTGTESDVEKEIVRRIYNGEWELVPVGLRAQLLTRGDNNLMGEIIKVLMITAAGAEGINLKNTRYVHIIEPHWHPVRIEQVIGRARRICSHSELPSALQTVDVYLYLMAFTQKQLDNDATIELKLKDVSKVDGSKAITTDEALYEIATLKEHITKKLLLSIQEASIDCTLHREKGSTRKCISFGTVSPAKLAFSGDVQTEELDAVKGQNIRLEELVARSVEIKGVQYAYDPTTTILYDWSSYEEGEPRQVGKLIKSDGDYIVELL